MCRGIPGPQLSHHYDCPHRTMCNAFVTAVPDIPHRELERIIRALYVGDLPLARHLMVETYHFLHPRLQNKISALAILYFVRLEVDAAPPEGACVCCAVERVLKAAGLDTDIYCCTHAHVTVPLCTLGQIKKTMQRLESKAARNPPRQRSVSPAASPYHSDDSESSQGGRVRSNRRTATRSPYARPTRRGFPPRTEYDYMLPPRFPEPEVDALTASLNSYNPFVAEPAPTPAPVPEVVLTAQLGGYTPFAVEPAPIPAPPPPPMYDMQHLVDDLAGYQISADEPASVNYDFDLSAVIGKFARQSLDAPPAWPSLLADYGN
ncbi:hypothetical protein AURDEDRAFT_116712 [Auricularia subglabra TFB-10046 SS5]|uniref:Uncharacterized protein n=1 Tax=Auricularia subglabra (strain TFB-10046 / SS5) TaxID=717982 RepID=J0DAT6_AURST|nr:hypothetical protein AURDEDRAFT_116712 [Auricularia subglabra TFB-10046 SS5]